MLALSSAMTFGVLQEILRLAHGIECLRSLKEVVLLRESHAREDLRDPGQPLNSSIETVLQALANCRNRFDKVVLVDPSAHTKLHK